MTFSQLPVSLPPEVGLLLVGHGTRYAPGIDEFQNVSRQVAARLDPRPVEPCFLEFAEPSIAAALARLVERGARLVVAAPVILFAAGHIRRDIPREVAAAAAQHGEVAVVHAAHLGCHPAIVQLSTRRFRQAAEGASPIAAGEAALVLVGRGSRDQEATAEMHRFAELRHASLPAPQIHTAFLAMADPLLEPTLRRIAAQAPRRIVVQPHLLFAGELLARVRSLVDALAAEYPSTDWLIAAHLGPDVEVVQAIIERAAEAVVALARSH